MPSPDVRPLTTAALAAILTVLGGSVTSGAELASTRMSEQPAFTGQTVSSTSFIGWRFEVASPLQVEQVGGHVIGIEGRVFAALISLPAIDAFPQGMPLAEEEVVGVAVWSPPATGESFAPLDALIEPGAYALVIGSGQMDAEGSAALPNQPDQTEIPPTTLDSYIRWRATLPGNQPHWLASSQGNMRMVVRGQALGGRADFNRDEVVDDADAAVWERGWGMRTEAAQQQGDATGDGAIDGRDLLVWQREYGARPTLAGVQVPAPGAMPLAWTAMLVGLAGRRRREPRCHASPAKRCPNASARQTTTAPS